MIKELLELPPTDDVHKYSRECSSARYLLRCDHVTSPRGFLP